jgi:hypothetical protein
MVCAILLLVSDALMHREYWRAYEDEVLLQIEDWHVEFAEVV